MKERRYNLWWKDPLSAVIAPVAQESGESAKKRRTLDLSLVPGRVTARFQDEAGKIYRAEFTPSTFTAEEWERVSILMAEEAIFIAALLSGVFPSALGDIFTRAELDLFPSTIESLRPRCECGGHVADPCRHLSNLLEKFVERVEEDPYSILLLRGFSRDELILDLKRRRSDLPEETEETGFLTVPPPVAPSVELSQEQFYTADQELFSMSYNLRADDLPASILKRLDPVPVGDGFDSLDFELEEAYAQIARRSQVFGLSLVRGPTPSSSDS